MEKSTNLGVQGLNIDKINISYDVSKSPDIDISLQCRMSMNFLSSLSTTILEKSFEMFGISNPFGASKGSELNIVVRDHEAFEEFLNKWSFEINIGADTIKAYPKEYFIQYLRNVNKVSSEVSESEVYENYLKEPIIINRLGIINGFLRVNDLVAVEWLKFSSSEPNFDKIDTEELEHFISKDLKSFEDWFFPEYGMDLKKAQEKFDEETIRKAYVEYIISDKSRYDKFYWWVMGDKDEQAPN